MTVPTLDFAEFRTAAHRLSEQRRTTEDSLRETVEQSADAEAAYRRGLAERLAHHRIDGRGAGESETLARGDVAHLSRDRDLHAGLVRVLSEKLKGLERDAATLRQLADWSQRQDAGVGG